MTEKRRIEHAKHMIWWPCSALCNEMNFTTWNIRREAIDGIVLVLVKMLRVTQTHEIRTPAITITPENVKEMGLNVRSQCQAWQPAGSTGTNWLEKSHSI